MYFVGCTYPRVETRLASVVALVIGSLVELLPQRLRLPRPELGLELRIELMKVRRLDLQEVAEVTKVTQDRLEGRGVAELVEHLGGHGHLGRDHLLTVAVQVMVIHACRI